MNVSYTVSFFLLLILSGCSSNPTDEYDFVDTPFTNVRFKDGFWSSRIDSANAVTVPSAFSKCEETGRINNFAIAGGIKEGDFQGQYPFDDSDVFKIMEGVAFLYANTHDEALSSYMDSLIYLFAKAQESDGYLYTNRTIGKNLHPWIGEQRWQNEWDNSHETYNLGHMFEAAVAHYKATGKKNFLNVATKAADLLYKQFGPGKKAVVPGHQVVEMGLVKLYRVTGDKRYLNLARIFLDSRGHETRFDSASEDMFRNGKYWQNHIPVVEQKEAVGHAVRALYMYSAMVDVASLLNDENYKKAVDTIWNNIVNRKLYITGGCGSSSHGESFGADYELPNKTAYCETCAAIANCMFNHRMFMMHGDAKYIDVLERSLYNGVLSGISFEGDTYFYPNPLEVGVEGQSRSEWFNCSCCPSNLARFIPSVSGYAYAQTNSAVYVNLYGSNDANIEIQDRQVKVIQNTHYPWDGRINLNINNADGLDFALKLRVPGWAQGKPVPGNLYTYKTNCESTIKVFVNGEKIPLLIEKGYAIVKRQWQAFDEVVINLPMKVNRVQGHPSVMSIVGKTAFEYGPIVYCAEFADNNGSVSDFYINNNNDFNVEFEDDLLEGVNTIKGSAQRVVINRQKNKVELINDSVVLIPFYARSHRGNGEMAVWLPSNKEIAVKNAINEFRIIDKVLVGDPNSEQTHNLQGENTNSGGSASSWRDASSGGWFSYTMKVRAGVENELVLTYNSLDGGNRDFEIYANNIKIGEQKLRTETYSAMIERDYPIPSEIFKNKTEVEIKLKALPDCIAGGIFGCRIQEGN